MKYRKTAALLAGTTAALLALTGCTAAGTSTSAAGSQNANHVFVATNSLDIIQDWDPAKTWSNSTTVFNQIYETLALYNRETGETEPFLAKSWTHNDAGTEWEFALEEGVKFHSGRALTADSVKQALQRSIAAGSSNAYVWESLNSIDVVDEHTVRFTFAYPTAADRVLSQANASAIYDVDAAGPGADLSAWLNQAHDAGTGPYTVSSWAKGQETEVTLARYDDYWRGWKDDQYNLVEFRVVPEETTRWQLLQSGEVNLFSPVNPQIVKQAQASKAADAQETPNGKVLIAQYNTASGPLTDVRIRKAVADAFDYKGIATALDGAVNWSGNLVGQGLLGYSDKFSKPTQNLDEAKKLLTEAGYGPGGKELTLNLTYAQGNQAQEVVVNLLASTLKDLNVVLDKAPLQWSTQWQKAKSEDPSQHQDIFIEYFPAGGYTDGYQSFRRLLRSESPTVFNLSYVNDPELDKRIDALPRLAVEDKAKAQSEYESLQQLVLNDRADLSVVYQGREFNVLSAGIDGYSVKYGGNYYVYDLSPGE